MFDRVHILCLYEVDDVPSRDLESLRSLKKKFLCNFVDMVSIHAAKRNFRRQSRRTGITDAEIAVSPQSLCLSFA